MTAPRRQRCRHECVRLATDQLGGPPLRVAVLSVHTSPLAQPGTTVFADVRGKRITMTVTKLPFVPARFHRS